MSTESLLVSKRATSVQLMIVQGIRTWFGYMSNPVPRHLRKMGYVRELRALRARRDRCRSDWHSHLEHTRAVILDAAAQCERHRSALVVGSGLLFDIPLEELSRRFERVVLADIVHAWSVHRRAAEFSNVRLLPLDVTGVVERCHALARRRSPAPLPQRAVDCLVGEGFDLVASVNVLSQLPVVPNGYMSRRIRSLTEAQTREFSRALVTITWAGCARSRGSRAWSRTSNACATAIADWSAARSRCGVSRCRRADGTGCGTWHRGRRCTSTSTSGTVSAATRAFPSGHGWMRAAGPRRRPMRLPPCR